jgi:hypothetical protein
MLASGTTKRTAGLRVPGARCCPGAHPAHAAAPARIRRTLLPGAHPAPLLPGAPSAHAAARRAFGTRCCPARLGRDGPRGRP